MESERAPAPDLFTALDWSARVASAAETPTNGAAPAIPPAPPSPPTPSSQRHATPVRVPDLVETRARGVPPAPSAEPVRASASFSGLADVLEPDADASPSLDELEGLLDDLDEPTPGQAEIAAASRTEAPAPAPARRADGLPQPRSDGLPSPRSARAPATPPRRPTPVMPRAAPVLPRPAAVSPDAATPIDFPAPGDPAESAQLHAPLPSSSLVSRVAPRIVDDEPEPASRRGLPWFWVALTLLLGAGLFWVLYTQTDIFSGDVIGNRNAKAQADAEAELEEQRRAAEANKKEYGTIEIDSEPKGARVFDLREGKEASFAALPIDHEYMVMVTAPGHLPRVRIVKGSELAAPVIVDLDPLPAGATPPPLPDERPPKLAQAPSKQTETLVLRSNTPGATLGLLVGFTPGVKIIDVDVAQPQRYLVVLAGYEPAEVVVKGRHFEEQNGKLAYFETVKLVPAAPVPPPAEADDADEDVVVDDDAAAGTPPAPATATKPAPAKTSPKKKKKKKRRRRR
jgi:hypothetical protein